MQFNIGAGKRSAAVLEPHIRVRNFGYGIGFRYGVPNNHICRITGFESMIFQSDQLCGPVADHFETFQQLFRSSPLNNVGIEAGDADHRSVTERRYGIEEVVGRQTTIDAAICERMGVGDAANDIVVEFPAHDEQIRCRQHGYRNPSTF